MATDHLHIDWWLGLAMA